MGGRNGNGRPAGEAGGAAFRDRGGEQELPRGPDALSEHGVQDRLAVVLALPLGHRGHAAAALLREQRYRHRVHRRAAEDRPRGRGNRDGEPSGPGVHHHARHRERPASTTCLSRFVQRMVSDHHNCWEDCTQAGRDMLTAIEAMANQIPLTPVDPSLVVSKALRLYDGTVASGQGRYTDSQIALYEFKTETGNIAYDTSGVEPAADLTISGAANLLANTWGLYIGAGGKAQATTTASAKLANLIQSTGEFSIEVWAIPANQAQLTANIVSYSGGPTASNFALQQNAFQYEGLTRSSVTDTNGMPPLATDKTNMLAQAALQHIVLTYDPVNGRK